MPVEPEISPHALLAVAVEVAQEAAAFVAVSRAGDPAVAATKSSATDVVTAVDQASEQLIRALLREHRPGDRVLGEEEGDPSGGGGGADRGPSRVRWVVDPVDGTVNFLYGLPQYAVSVAAELDGEVVAGVVVDVVRREVWSAVRGGGSTRDGHPLRVRATPPLAERLVLTGFSYEADVRAAQGQAVARMLPRVRDVRRFGSAALDLCFLAAGLADGYVEEGPQLWDHAAAGLVATEAGARLEVLTGVGGLDLVLCAPEEGYDELAALVAECGFLADDGPLPGTR